MKNWNSLSLIAIATLSLNLAGCMNEPYPGYSSGVKYGLRVDPIVRGVAASLGDERFDPDRPGVLPVMNFDEVFKPESPYYPKIKQKLAPDLNKIIADKKGKDAKLSEEERNKLEEQILSDHSHYKEFYKRLDNDFLRNPALIKDRGKLEEALETMFGTPLKPSINVKFAELDANAFSVLKLDDATLARGSSYYRVQCMHCHGVPGDGRGPTARWINPHPRDFRRGVFKFMSVNQLQADARPPARADLLRTLRQGLEGTAMPSFSLLPDDQMEDLVSYVIFLSVRGSTEYRIMKENFDFVDGALVCQDDESNPIPYPDIVKSTAKKYLAPGSAWLKSQEPASAIDVPPYPDDPYNVEAIKASVQRGKRLFNAEPSKDKGGVTASCVSCHINYGRQAKFRFDEWGTLVRPNNFTLGIFRGGRRPVDIYYRIHSGIAGSGMPAFGKLEPRQIWDLVNFVSTLSYPGMRARLDINIDETH